MAHGWLPASSRASLEKKRRESSREQRPLTMRIIHSTRRFGTLNGGNVSPLWGRSDDIFFHCLIIIINIIAKTMMTVMTTSLASTLIKATDKCRRTDQRRYSGVVDGPLIKSTSEASRNCRLPHHTTTSCHLFARVGLLLHLRSALGPGRLQIGPANRIPCAVRF